MRLQHDRDGVSVERARAAPWLVCVCVLVLYVDHTYRVQYMSVTGLLEIYSSST